MKRERFVNAGMSSSSSEAGLGNSASGSSIKDQNNESNLMEVTSREAVHKPQKRLLGRIWNAFSLVGSLFYRSHNEDFGKKLEHLSKEEAAIHARLRGMIIYSIIIEVLVILVILKSFSLRTLNPKLKKHLHEEL